MPHDPDEPTLLVCCDETCTRDHHLNYNLRECATCDRKIWVNPEKPHTVAVCIPCFEEAKRTLEAN